jgi:hypothetical protein
LGVGVLRPALERLEGPSAVRSSRATKMPWASPIRCLAATASFRLSLMRTERTAARASDPMSSPKAGGASFDSGGMTRGRAAVGYSRSHRHGRRAVRRRRRT